MNMQTRPEPRDRAERLLQPAESPIRSTFLPEDRMRQLGELMARQKLDSYLGLTGFDFQARVREDAAHILDVYKMLNVTQAKGDAVTPAAQWILDNHYVVEETIFQVKRDLPRRFYSQLPTMDIGGGVMVPRALAIAWVYVAHCDSNVSSSGLKAIVDGFQSVQPLKIGELWALPSLLRFVLVENLRRLARRVQRAHEMRQLANTLADRVLAAQDGDVRTALLSEYANHAVDTTFATQLLYRLRDGSQNAGTALAWLESQLEARGSDAEETIVMEHRTLASGNVTTGNIIRGLRLINDIDWSVWFETVSLLDDELRAATDFADLDFQSRDQFRTAIETLARYSGQSEHDVAVASIDLSKSAAQAGDPESNVAYFLIGKRRPELEQRIGYKPTLGDRFHKVFRQLGWIGIMLPVLAITMLLLGMTTAALENSGLSSTAVTILVILFAIPAGEGATSIFNTVVLLLTKPTRLVGYEYRDGIPDEGRTLVAMPTLITSRDDVEEAVRNLEVHYLSNVSPNLYFALVTDWSDSQAERSQEDDEILAFARNEIAALNRRHPVDGPDLFHLIHRRRLFNPAQGVWMGWERKRGKLHELNMLLRGDSDTTILPLDRPLPTDIVHVMTLDSDTRITRDAVTGLVGKLMHPMNKPEYDAAAGVVTGGYSILQPRVTASLTTGDEASFFQRVFSSNRGLDPYVFAVSDLYQDMFGQGTFTGKGLYHVDAMEAALKGKLPDNVVLSHDLLEGALARCALVTDVEVVEDYPTRYSVDASRQHRWARGDWQLLPLIFDPKLAIPSLSRWKMIDNLRRSLTPIFWVLAAIAGWTLLPFTLAAQWIALLILSQFMAPTFNIVNSLIPKSLDTTFRGHLTALARDVAYGTALVASKTVFMAHSAWMMGDAIVRTLYRLLVSHKNMLEWRTASQAFRSGGNSIEAYCKLMKGAFVIAAVGLAAPLIAGSTGVIIAAIFAIFWAGSPVYAFLVSRSAETEDKLEISAQDTEKLRNFARRTWHYFETFVTPEHSFLPPDNFQEVPHPVVAGRTSPTNIGVYLLSVVSARDFGWIGMADAVERLEATMSTLERMERSRGHLYNWYDTRTLMPLRPLYISAVDSGNLAGHLIAVAAACNEWAESPSVYLQADFAGMLDVIDVLGQCLRVVPDDRRQLRPLRQRLEDRISGMRRSVEAVRSEPELASIRTLNLAVLAGEIRKVTDAIDHEVKSSATAQLAEWGRVLERTAEAHVGDAHSDKVRVDELRERLQKLRVRMREYALGMDFSFLLNQARKLLSIGYRVEEHQLDASCYDLLASECRLTSLLAIAKGDIPTDHWFRLGRPLVEIGFSSALMSWSGSMFEYLMPPLVMKEPQGGILNQTNRMIIRRQMQYGEEKGIPWGISEAAYNARDHEMTYQYTNFGVPGLGLKRGLGQNTVIAPYATVLATQFFPSECVENLERLIAVGALGRYGFYDAVDFTPQRVPEGQKCAVVYNYMAHHSGMSIVAIADAVFEGRMRDRFHSDPVVEAAELLLQERAPRDIPVATIRADAAERVKVESEPTSPDTRVILDPQRSIRATNLLASGGYSVMLTATGSGNSRWGDLSINRWQPDPVDDRLGSYVFLRDMASGEWWSATSEPKRVEGETAQTYFSDDKAHFVKQVGEIKSELECTVVVEGHGEARRITIHNEGNEDRHIEITTFSEVVIGSEASDNAHPAFSKMFVETEIAEGANAIYATRRKRSSSDPDIVLAHFVTDPTSGARDAEAETDRRAFIGRGRSISEAAAFDPDARLTGSAGFVLDPIVSLRRRVRVQANKKVSLTFWTVVGKDRAEVDNQMAHLDHADSFARQSMLAWTSSQVQTRHVGLTLADAANVQRLASSLIYPDRYMRAAPETIASGMGGQGTLWPMAISGDFPIFSVRIADQADLDIVAQALRYQEYLRGRGLVADFVVINEQAASYVQDLQQAIESLCENSRARGREFGPRQHIFAVRRDLMDEQSYKTLIAASRVVLHTRNGTVFDQIERAETAAIQAQEVRVVNDAPVFKSEKKATKALAPAVAPAGDGLEYWNGFGGFANEGRDYVVRLSAGRATPQPWVNVVANQGFGFHTSAEGASFSWSRNSRDFQLTPWSNDPVTNRPGEAFYVYDQDQGCAFAPYVAVAPDPAVIYETRHRQGMSVFTATRDKLTVELTQLVDASDPVKVMRLRIVNKRAKAAKLRVYGYAEWVLGTNRGKSAPTIVPSHDPETGAVFARNPYSIDFSDRVAFLATNGPGQTATADREEFFGGGTVERPRLVVDGAALSGKVEAGCDPCSAVASDISVPAGQQATMIWLLGDAASADEAQALIKKHLAADFDKRIADVDANWRGFLETVQVDTPDPAFNAMVNTWLPYQSLSCRIRARSAFYQASGAFGFRDQLQDTLALLLHDPALAREQILNAAGRQFKEGDVQHWWLPRTGAGVRTLISDDVVWLGYAIAHYIGVTGDRSILAEKLPFIEGAPLEPGQHDAFYTPEVSSEKATVYEHAARALDLSIARTSQGGLPLILGGDWNDGMNNVGVKGKGESVWLGWFLLKAIDGMAPIARAEGDKDRAAKWEKHAEKVKRALEATAWDGSWYRRGSYDDGSPLGSHKSKECQIDSIAQSWSVLSGQGDESRSRTAMRSVDDRLIDEKLKLIRLFTPPFENSDKDPGYIKSYPPGVRENGGQYTHAATWVVAALAEMGEADEAYRCFSMLNPIQHALDEASAEAYRVEPYVIAADVYSEGEKAGRGGWTWYTGSAGWMYRVAVEYILGLRRQGDQLMLKPAIPSSWDRFAASVVVDGVRHDISVVRDKAVRKMAIQHNGKPVKGAAFALGGKGPVKVEVKLPARRRQLLLQLRHNLAASRPLSLQSRC